MLAETAVDSFVTMLKARLPETLEIKDYVISEADLRSVQVFPIVFVLCPNFSVIEWMSDGYIDVQYDMVFGVICLNQDTNALRRSLYKAIEEIIKALIASQSDANFAYTMMKRQTFNANFGPIFTSRDTEQFMADAQLTVSVKKIVAETLVLS